MKKITAYWFLENFDFMHKLGKKNLMKLSETMEMEHFQRGDSVHYSNNPNNRVIFLKKGSVKIVDSSSNTVKYLVREGNIFGELDDQKEMIDEYSSDEHAVCLEDVVACYLTSSQMISILNEFPSLKNHIIKIQSFRIKKLERRLSDLLYKTSEERISEFIFSYVKEYGKKQGDSYSIKNNLTHQDIANLTNSSRQTVNNVISSLRKKGVLDYSRKRISIKNKMISSPKP